MRRLVIATRNPGKAREIAEGSLSNAEKIAELRKHLFKAVDELEASGNVVLPE